MTNSVNKCIESAYQSNPDMFQKVLAYWNEPISSGYIYMREQAKALATNKARKQAGQATIKIKGIMTAGNQKLVRGALYRQQSGQCKLCGCALVMDDQKKNLPIDHDHLTGFIRGLLCVSCNTYEGWLVRRTAKALANEGQTIDPKLTDDRAYIQALINDHRAN